MSLLGNIPKPDWEKRSVVLVDPAAVIGYRRCGSDLAATYASVIGALTKLEVRFEALTATEEAFDIWIRDWGPVEGAFYIYRPSYAPNTYTDKAIWVARRLLERRLGSPMRRIPVVLDGGNLVHNGTTAIVTEKIFLDNRHLSHVEVEEAILSLGFQRLVRGASGTGGYDRPCGRDSSIPQTEHVTGKQLSPLATSNIREPITTTLAIKVAGRADHPFPMVH